MTMLDLRHPQSFHLQCRLKQAIILRDVGILVRFSEPPFSTTIQIFLYQGAIFCALAASFVESAGSHFKTSPVPARRGGVSNGVAECLV
jgi:hypothetical protein